ncbi:MAG: dihydrodipicolinate reductase [bacterium]|nr:dihydrodipicolinate reductase [bacterium]
MAKKSEKIKVVHYGLGHIGLMAARIAVQSERLEVVGAVDVSAEKAGKDLGELLGAEKPLGITVSNKSQEVLTLRPDVVVHSTGSRLGEVLPQLEEIVSRGANVVSSTEELLFPVGKNKQLVEKLDELAKENDVSVLGTGVNPGFVLDSLPAFLTAVCSNVKSIFARRIVDASTRREPLQKKVGAGLSLEEFRRRVKEGRLGHVGLIESVALIADCLGWELDNLLERVDPVIADGNIKTKYVEVREGQAAGIRHTAKGIRKGERVISLELQMFVGAPEPHDYIRIDAEPPLEVTVENGTAGDPATAAILVNAIPRVLAARAGYVTMKDLGLISALG